MRTLAGLYLQVVFQRRPHAARSGTWTPLFSRYWFFLLFPTSLLSVLIRSPNPESFPQEFNLFDREDEFSSVLFWCVSKAMKSKQEELARLQVVVLGTLWKCAGFFRCC